MRERVNYLEVIEGLRVEDNDVVLENEFNNHINDESLHGGDVIDTIENYGQTINATVSTAEYAQSGGSGGGDGGAENIPTTRHIDDFGADPTGNDSSDDALDDAVDAAAEGDIIAITNGTYYFSERHTFHKSLVIDGQGSRIESDCHTDVGSTYESGSDEYQGHHYYPLFKFEGSKGSHVDVTSSASRGSDQLEVESTSNFEVGDGITVANMDSTSSVQSRDYTPTVSRVRKIDGNTLYLTKALKYETSSGWQAAPVDFVYYPVIRNMKIYPRDEPSFDSSMGRVMGGPQHPFATQWTYGALIDNCYVDTYGSNVYTSTDCANAVVRDVHSGHPMNLSGSSGEAYYIIGSSDITLVRPVVEGCRRAIDIRSGCRTLYTIDPRISGVSLGAISFHSGSDEPVQGRHEIRGGYIHCRMEEELENPDGSEDERWEVMSGTLVRGDHEDCEVVVSDCELVANAWDQNTYGNWKFNNCRIVKPADGYTGESPLDLNNGVFEFYGCEFDVNGANALQVSGGSGSIKLNNITSNAPIDLTGGSHDVWLGIVDAPNVDASDARDPYNVT